MTRTEINVRNVDEIVWRKFRGRCALLNKPTGQELTSALIDYLERGQDGTNQKRKSNINSSTKSLSASRDVSKRNADISKSKD